VPESVGRSRRAVHQLDWISPAYSLGAGSVRANERNANEWRPAFQTVQSQQRTNGAPRHHQVTQNPKPPGNSCRPKLRAVRSSALWLTFISEGRAHVTCSHDWCQLGSHSWPKCALILSYKEALRWPSTAFCDSPLLTALFYGHRRPRFGARNRRCGSIQSRRSQLIADSGLASFTLAWRRECHPSKPSGRPRSSNEQLPTRFREGE
jgi:hypothetical protein